MLNRLRAAARVRQLPSAARGAPVYLRSRYTWAVRRLLQPEWMVPCVVSHVSGAKFYLSRDPLDDTVFRELYDLYWDLFFPAEIGSLPERALILDVGAHHGFYSVAALRHYVGAHLIAVEPDPIGARCLRRNLRLNRLESRAEVVEAALGTHDGAGLLEQSQEGSWANKLTDSSKAGDAVQVKVVSLAGVLQGRTPTIVKSNCEGGEFALIPQLFDLAMRPKYIILLVHPSEGDAKGLLARISSQGYEMSEICSSEAQPRYLCRLR